jgi:hypothetical protein
MGHDAALATAVQWGTCHPGQQIRLRFDGPASRVQALMWGRTP